MSDTREASNPVALAKERDIRDASERKSPRAGRIGRPGICTVVACSTVSVLPSRPANES
jgi:hypothetical protein